MVWDPVECGVQPNGRAFYFTQLPTEMNRVERTGDVLFGLILPIGNEDKVKNFIIGELDLKSQKSKLESSAKQVPDFSFHSSRKSSCFNRLGCKLSRSTFFMVDGSS